MNERGFSRAADAGDDGERAERKHQVHILEIVQRGAIEAKKFARGLVAIGRERECAIHR